MESPTIKIFRLSSTFIESEALVLSLAQMIKPAEDTNFMMAPLWTSVVFGMSRELIAEDSVISIKYIRFDPDAVNFSAGHSASMKLTMSLYQSTKNEIIALTVALLSMNPLISEDYLAQMENGPIANFFSTLRPLLTSIQENLDDVDEYIRWNNYAKAKILTAQGAKLVTAFRRHIERRVAHSVLNPSVLGQ